MKKERMKILLLLEEGKITADEAARLFESLGATKNTKEFDTDDLEETIVHFSKNMESFSNEIANKLSGTYKNVEPKFKQATRSVVEKAANLTDEISKSLHESLKNFSDDKQEGCCDSNGCSCEASNDYKNASNEEDNKN